MEQELCGIQHMSAQNLVKEFKGVGVDVCMLTPKER